MSALRAEPQRRSQGEQPYDPLLTPEDAAKVLQVSAYTVRQWAKEGKIPALRLGKFWRFRASSLKAWTEAQERLGR